MSKPTPKKPYSDFPLTAHSSGQWCKKIRGKIHYFGKDADSALRKYLHERDELQAGMTPRNRGQKRQLTMKYMVDAYLTRCEGNVETGDLKRVTFNDYVGIGKLIVGHFGKSVDPHRLEPLDFARFRTSVAKSYSSHRLSKIVTVTKQIFKWAKASKLLKHEVEFGPDFQIASKKNVRLEKEQNGKKVFTCEEIRGLLDAADAKWKAIILLGINGGLGNTDIAGLTLNRVGGEWLEYPRIKTGEPRRIPLWQETQDAIKAAIAERPKSETNLLFVSEHGGPMIAAREKSRTDLVVQGFRRLLEKAGAKDDDDNPKGIYQKGMGFYWLRHTFQTIGDDAGQPIATSAIMGHSDGTMAARYREFVNDDKLQAVTQHVRAWLFA